MADELTLTIDGPDGDDQLAVPADLIDLLREDDADSAAEVVGDVAMLGLAQRIHGAVHHAQGEVDPDVEAAEAATMESFEERFGATYAEMTGHGH